MIMNTEKLNIHLSYKRLKARDLAQLLNELSELSDMIVKRYYGDIVEDMNIETSLDISTIATGHSVIISLVESAIEGFRQTMFDSAIDIAKMLSSIPLILGYCMFQGVKQYPKIRKDYLDIQLKKDEVKLKERELNNVISDNKQDSIGNAPRIRTKISNTLRFIYDNADFEMVEINGIKIKF